MSAYRDSHPADVDLLVDGWADRTLAAAPPRICVPARPTGDRSAERSSPCPVGVDRAASHEFNRRVKDRSAQRYPKRVCYNDPICRLKGIDSLAPTGISMWCLLTASAIEKTRRPSRSGPWCAGLIRSPPAALDSRSAAICQHAVMFHLFRTSQGLTLTAWCGRPS
jgi:hypothetical protein